jgi:adenine phosphoribosyltransferase
VAIRKSGKLPGECIRGEEYLKEYGADAVEIQKDSINESSKVLLIDDLLATGGTLNAATDLIRLVKGAHVAGCAVVFEIENLAGRKKLKTSCSSLIMIRD